MKSKSSDIIQEREALLEKLRLIEEAKGILKDGGTESSMRALMSDIDAPNSDR
jgi:hypothetical protein